MGFLNAAVPTLSSRGIHIPSFKEATRTNESEDTIAPRSPAAPVAAPVAKRGDTTPIHSPPPAKKSKSRVQRERDPQTPEAEQEAVEEMIVALETATLATEALPRTEAMRRRTIQLGDDDEEAVVQERFPDGLEHMLDDEEEDEEEDEEYEAVSVPGAVVGGSIEQEQQQPPQEVIVRDPRCISSGDKEEDWADTCITGKSPPLGRGLQYITDGELVSDIMEGALKRSGMRLEEIKGEMKEAAEDENWDRLGELKTEREWILDTGDRLLGRNIVIVRKDGDVYLRRMDETVVGGRGVVTRFEIYSLASYKEKWLAIARELLYHYEKYHWGKTIARPLFGKPGKDVLNTFLGYAVERDNVILDYDFDDPCDEWPSEGIKELLGGIKFPRILKTYLTVVYCIVEKRDDLFVLFLWWLADILQNPGKRPTFGWFFFGDFGVGKTTVLMKFGALLGVADAMAEGGHGKLDTMFAVFDGVDKILGNFNSAAVNKLLVLFDDQSKDNKMKSDPGAFQNWVTRNYSLLEKKFKEPVPVMEVAAFAGCTNFEDALNLQSGQRRIVYCTAGSDFKGQDGFWKDLQNTCDSPEWKVQTFKFFMTLDLTKYNRCPGRLPVTDIMKRSMTKTAPVEVKYILDRFVNNPDPLPFVHCLQPDCKGVHKVGEVFTCQHRIKPVVIELSATQATKVPKDMFIHDWKTWQANRIEDKTMKGAFDWIDKRVEDLKKLGIFVTGQKNPRKEIKREKWSPSAGFDQPLYNPQRDDHGTYTKVPGKTSFPCYEVCSLEKMREICKRQGWVVEGEDGDESDDGMEDMDQTPGQEPEEPILYCGKPVEWTVGRTIQGNVEAERYRVAQIKSAKEQDKAVKAHLFTHKDRILQINGLGCFTSEEAEAVRLKNHIAWLEERGLCASESKGSEA
jgi:hypothetical protein